MACLVQECSRCFFFFFFRYYICFWQMRYIWMIGYLVSYINLLIVVSETLKKNKLITINISLFQNKCSSGNCEPKDFLMLSICGIWRDEMAPRNGVQKWSLGDNAKLYDAPWTRFLVVPNLGWKCWGVPFGSQNVTICCDWRSASMFVFQMP